MNVLGKLKKAIAIVGGRAGNKLKTIFKGLPAKSSQPAKPKGEDPLRVSQLFHKLFSYSGPVFGPSVPPNGEWHHVSRQTCRAYLRTLYFETVSRRFPLMARRDRRRLARLTACIEYRAMLKDRTNQVDNERDLLAAV